MGAGSNDEERPFCFNQKGRFSFLLIGEWIMDIDDRVKNEDDGRLGTIIDVERGHTHCECCGPEPDTFTVRWDDGDVGDYRDWDLEEVE